MLDFTLENIGAEDIERLRAAYEPLAQSVRELVDATVRTQADAAAVAAAKSEIDSATARLRSRQLDGTFGVRYLATGERMAWGNAVIGIRNPIAPPLAIHHDAAGKSWCDFHLGAAYEGPPGHVHGGVAAPVLDHLLGEAASDGVNPRFIRNHHPSLPASHPAGPPACRGDNHARRRGEDIRGGSPRRRRGRHRRSRGRVHPAPMGVGTVAMEKVDGEGRWRR